VRVSEKSMVRAPNLNPMNLGIEIHRYLGIENLTPMKIDI